jgi:hypothetical protein
MEIDDRLQEICNRAVEAGEHGYISVDGKWFPKPLLTKFKEVFLDVATLPCSENLKNIGIARIKRFAAGLDSECYLAKNGGNTPFNVCIRKTNLRDEPMPRSSVDFNLQAHYIFTNQHYRVEVLPLIFVPIPHPRKRIGGLPLSRFLSIFCEDTHDLSETRLGIADMGVLPDGTILNVDAGNCPMPRMWSSEDVQQHFRNDVHLLVGAPTPLTWRNDKGELKQKDFFPNPFS